jgi:hypothetical protein
MLVPSISWCLFQFILARGQETQGTISGLILVTILLYVVLVNFDVLNVVSSLSYYTHCLYTFTLFMMSCEGFVILASGMRSDLDRSMGP